MTHHSFVMNVAPPAGHLPAQNAVFCRQCSNDGRPKMIVPPSGALPWQLVAFIRKHNAQYK
jgi:hypothetical protein